MTTTMTMTPARRQVMRATIAEGDNCNCAKTRPVHQQQQRLRIGNNNDTASCEAATHQEAEVAHCEANVARGQEAALVQQVGCCKLGQPDGKEEVKVKL